MGKIVELPGETEEECIRALASVMSVLNGKEREIAESLIGYWEDWDQLSEKQWSLLDSLVSRARKRQRMQVCPHCGGSGIAPAADNVVPLRAHAEQDA